MSPASAFWLAATRFPEHPEVRSLSASARFVEDALVIDALLVGEPPEQAAKFVREMVEGFTEGARQAGLAAPQDLLEVTSTSTGATLHGVVPLALLRAAGAAAP